MSLSKLKKLLIIEDISFHHRPTTKEADKTIIGLYRRAYFDYRESRNIINRAYLRGVIETAMALLGTTRFNTIKRKIEREYIKHKIR